MPNLQTLRQTRALAVAVLAWFVLSLGVAIASPMVKPEVASMVCSVGGTVKWVAGNDDGSAPMPSHKLGCVLCLTLSAPPSVQALSLVHALAATYALVSAPSAYVAWRTASPLPARGPPSA